METWILFWKIINIVSILAFVGVVIFVIPSGAMGAISFFKELADSKTEQKKKNLKQRYN
jgi:hypothetical protein